MPDPSNGSDKPRRVVLLIDEDPKVGRLAHLSLHGPNCQVMATTRFLEGLRMATRKRPDLILMEVAFDKADGIELAQKLLRAPETKSCRLAFISSDTSPRKMVQGIQLGAQDYILKPLEGKQLSTRVEAIFRRIETGDALEGPVAGAGAEALAQQLQRVEREAGSCVIQLCHQGQQAMLTFTMGKLQQAELGELRADRALVAIAAQGEWELTLEGEEQPSSSPAEATAPPELDLEEDADDDLSSTQPRLPAFSAEDEQPWCASETPAPRGRPPTGAPQPGLAPGPNYAPEPGLGGPADQVDVENKTLVESGAAPLASYAFSGLPSPAERDAPLDISATEEFFDDDFPTSLQFNEDYEALLDQTSPQSPPAPSRADPTVKAEAQRTVSPVDEIATAPRALSDLGRPGVLKPPTLRSAPSSAAALPGSPKSASTPARAPGAGGAVPAAAARGTTAPPEPPAPEALRRYLAAMGQTPLVLIMPNHAVRATLVQAAGAAGYRLNSVSNGQQAYTAAQEQRPLAFIADTRLPDMEGREFLWAIRIDFLAREIPFLMASGEELLPKVTAVAEAAVAPILAGLESALGPAVHLHEQLIAENLGELTGRVEPVGLATLLRIIGATGVTGSLQLRNGEERSAEVVLCNGEICGVTVNAPASDVGPMAMLHLAGYAWEEFRFTCGRVSEVQVPLGTLAQLVDTACKQNNILLGRIYQQGVQIEDVSVDRAALDLYLKDLPPSSIELLIRLIEGDRAAELADQGIAPQGVLRSMLYELRRNAVLRTSSLRPVRADADLHSVGRKPSSAEAPSSPGEPLPQRKRWLVALVAGLSTVALAAVGYFLYYRFGG